MRERATKQHIMVRKTSLLVVLSVVVVVVLTIGTLVQMSSNDFMNIIRPFESNEINIPRPPFQREDGGALKVLASDMGGLVEHSSTSVENPDTSTGASTTSRTPVSTSSTPAKKSKTVLAPPYIQVTHVPSQRRSRTSNLSNLSKTTTRPDSISLVVGYWAQPGSFFTNTSMSTTSASPPSSFNQSNYERPHPHRAEIEAAMVNNLHNPYIHQLVVVLDSVSDEANCTYHFIPHMQRLSRLVQSEHPQFFQQEQGEQQLQLPCTLTCIDRVEAQPTYLEMFQYSSSSEFVEGPVVLMANTDQAFDTSLKLAAHLQPNAISVISTRGFEKTFVPPSLLEPYKTIMMNQQEQYEGGRTIITAQETNIHTTPNLCKKINQWGGTPSWDSFLFHRDMVARGLDELDPTLFVRGEKHIRYFMNEMGAENAALYDLTKALESVMEEPPQEEGSLTTTTTTTTTTHEPSTLHIWNSCFLIQSWDFHLEAKMHKKREEKGAWARVPKPAGPKPKPCGSSMAKAVFDPTFLVVKVPDCRLNKRTKMK